MALANEGLERIRECVELIMVLNDSQTDKMLLVLDELLSNIAYSLSKKGRETLASQVTRLLYSVKVSENLRERVIYQGVSLTIESSKRQGLLRQGENTFEITRILGEGTYGLAFQSFLNGRQTVTKMPHETREGEVKSEKEEKADLSDFLYESVVHLLLTCLSEEIGRSIPGWWRRPFPDLYLLVKTQAHFERALAVMETLDMTATDYLDTHPPEEGIINLFLQVTYYLYYLQQVIGFMHRDLGPNNVMIKGKPTSMINFGHLGPSRIESTFDVYLIDFGNVCLDLSLCPQCDMPFASTIAGWSPWPYEQREWVCDDPSYDLRLFFGSIWYIYERELEALPIIGKFFDHLFTEEIEDRIDLYFTLGEYDPKFDPKNVLKWFQKALD